MTHLMAKTTGFPRSAWSAWPACWTAPGFCSLVALTGVARPQDVSAIALGSHGPEMVIPLSQATVNGKPLEDAPARRLRSTRSSSAPANSGAEVVKLLQKGSAYFAPAESAAAMVVDMVRESDRVQAACVQSGGAYGLRTRASVCPFDSADAACGRSSRSADGGREGRARRKRRRASQPARVAGELAAT